MRAGADALSLLAVPLNIHLLRGLEQESRALIDLQRAVGSPPRTTVRAHLCNLADTGIVERRRSRDFPLSVEYVLTPSGRELIAVAEAVESWLGRAPAGSVALGERAAKSALKALVDGWRSGVIRALAGHPLSLTELNSLIPAINYPTLERRLASMRLAGQIEVCRGRGTPYRPTHWLRQAVAALAVAARWERQHVSAKTTPIGRLEVESAFLLTVPVLRLSPELSGTCRLAVELRSGGGEPGMAGILAKVEQGRVIACVSRPQGAADGWASGTANAWIETMFEGRSEGLEIGGHRQRVREILDVLSGSLHQVLRDVRS